MFCSCVYFIMKVFKINNALMYTTTTINIINISEFKGDIRCLQFSMNCGLTAIFTRPS